MHLQIGLRPGEYVVAACSKSRVHCRPGSATLVALEFLFAIAEICLYVATFEILSCPFEYLTQQDHFLCRKHHGSCSRKAFTGTEANFGIQPLIGNALHFRLSGVCVLIAL